MAEKTLKKIRIKWVRSGIGFTYHQKRIVQSLGLNKLNHSVVRPDTPQIRGIVASVPHLLEIVPEPSAPAWVSIPEYTVHAPAEVPPPLAESTTVVISEAGNEAVHAQAEAAELTPADAGLEKESSLERSESARAIKE